MLVWEERLSLVNFVYGYMLGTILDDYMLGRLALEKIGAELLP